MTILSSLVASHIVLTTPYSDTINYKDGILTTVFSEIALAMPI